MATTTMEEEEEVDNKEWEWEEEEEERDGFFDSLSRRWVKVEDFSFPAGDNYFHRKPPPPPPPPSSSPPASSTVSILDPVPDPGSGAQLGLVFFYYYDY